MKYDSLCVSAIRALSIDMINRAKSGHPGMALDAAPLAYTLYSRFLTADPKHPDWIKRDRFVLSAGHASAMLYSLLHIAGYAVTMDDLKSFRQLGSKTPGHPEYGVTPGVDCTSGPLGQGISQAVGMAIAETHLRALYPDSNDLFSHYTYCLCGDGCLQEGVSCEAAALAAKLKLNKLILISDANPSTLDGPSSWTFEEDVGMRFRALGWNFIHVTDGNDIEALAAALDSARHSDSPTLIQMDTLIGYGSVNQGTSKTHGAPLGLEDGEHAKKVYGWDYPPFVVPDEVYMTMRESFQLRGETAYAEWEKAKQAYFVKHPEASNLIDESLSHQDINRVFKGAPAFDKAKDEATRSISGSLLNLVQQELPNLIGGSADVASSVKTDIKGGVDYSPAHREGTVLRFGIREFAMASVCNGIALHGGLRTYCGSFMVFADYFKAAIRMSALQHLPVVYLMSHDSIAVGEDGPTHQPVEQLAMLRSIPNLAVYRPADAVETAAAYRAAFTATDHPTVIILTRQKVPQLLDSSDAKTTDGGYIVSREKRTPMATVIASGSEVSLAIEAQKRLLQDGIDIRVVSMPELNIFLSQPKKYQKEVLGNPRDKRLYIEMCTPYGPFALADDVMCINAFGASGPASQVMEKMGFTVDRVVERVRRVVARPLERD